MRSSKVVVSMGAWRGSSRWGVARGGGARTKHRQRRVACSGVVPVSAVHRRTGTTVRPRVRAAAGRRDDQATGLVRAGAPTQIAGSSQVDLVLSVPVSAATVDM